MGIANVIVSGRSPYLVQSLGLAPELLALFEPTMVLRDGDILWNWRTDTIEQQRTIPDTVVPTLPFPDFVVDTGRCLVASSDRAADRHAVTYRCPRTSITVSARPPASSAVKVTIYADPAEVLAALHGLDGCAFTATARDRCSVVPPNSCKAAGLTVLLGHKTLTKVIAFGDGANDACLLRSAGAGIAMAIADPDTARDATRQLTGPLAAYLTDEFPHGLAPRRPRPCPHRR